MTPGNSESPVFPGTDAVCKYVTRCLSEEAPALVLIAGGSQSGKSTLSRELEAELSATGRGSRIIELDRFYYATSDVVPLSLDFMFDNPRAIRWKLAVDGIEDLLAGEDALIPNLVYASASDGSATSTYGEPELVMGARNGVVIVEGIFAHYLSLWLQPQLSLFLHCNDRALLRERRLLRDVTYRALPI